MRTSLHNYLEKRRSAPSSISISRVPTSSPEKYGAPAFATVDEMMRPMGDQIDVFTC